MTVGFIWGASGPRRVSGEGIGGAIKGGGDLGKEVLERLRRAHRLKMEDFVSSYVNLTTGSPFRVLVATILSQNSTDKAAMRAYSELERSVGLTPEALVRAGLRRIARAIRVAGLADAKARAIRELAALALRLGDPNLKGLLESGPDAAREVLLRIKGIGPKTVDVLLSSTGTLDTIPVDTHVRRVAQRLGLVGERESYERIKSRLEEVFPPGTRYEAHLLLIAHGRSVCRSRRPLCDRCVLSDLCGYYRRAAGGS